MNSEQKLKLIDEIKKMERELFLKKSQLTASESDINEKSLSGQITGESGSKECQRVFYDLIKRIGKSSSGGSSVEDIRRERAR